MMVVSSPVPQAHSSTSSAGEISSPTAADVYKRQILSFVLGRLVPKTWFDYTRFPYRTFAFERNGKLYEALRVSRWQSRVPDMSRLFPKLMPPKKMPARPDEQTLLVMPSGRISAKNFLKEECHLPNKFFKRENLWTCTLPISIPG